MNEIYYPDALDPIKKKSVYKKHKVKMASALK